MDLGLDGRVALVTGGSQGIGAAVCRELARQGCAVAFTYVGREGDGDAVVTDLERAGRRALAIMADSSRTDQTEAAFAKVLETLGRLDILVCNAGHHLGRRDLEDDRAAVGRRHRRQPARATSTTTGRPPASSRTRSTARSSTSRRSTAIRGKFGQANYAASKGGVIALSKTLAQELGKFNVNGQRGRAGHGADRDGGRPGPEFRHAAVRETVLGRLRRARGRRPPGRVPVLGLRPARHRARSSSRRRTVHLSCRGAKGPWMARVGSDRRRARPSSGGAATPPCRSWRSRPTAPPCPTRDLEPGRDRRHGDRRGARVPQAAVGGGRRAGVPEPQSASRPG